MRLTVTHETTYFYETPAKSVIQVLRLTPRPHEGQHIIRWRISLDQEAKLTACEDAFGNQTHVFTVNGPLDSLTIVANGDIDLSDTNGVVGGTIERFPVALFLRETGLVTISPEIRAFAAEAATSSATALEACHALLGSLGELITLDEDEDATSSDAATAFAAGKATERDLAHIFIAAARARGIPARFVSGLMHKPDGEPQRHRHSWAEAHIDDLGWVGFDPTLGHCPRESHLRITVGLDYLDTAPIRGSRYGGDSGNLKERIEFAEQVGRGQRQRQRQS